VFGVVGEVESGPDDPARPSLPADAGELPAEALAERRTSARCSEPG
jgi:hypothetical protein